MEKFKEQLVAILKRQSFSDSIVSAFEKVNRERFVPEQFQLYAYEDMAIPLKDGSSLPQPSTIAFMLSLLDPKQNQKILEIGSGSGYVLSLISEIIKSGKIYGLEIDTSLAIESRKILSHDTNITILNRSGNEGLIEQAPFDRILVSASFTDKKIPEILIKQLKDQGIMVYPLENSIIQVKKIDSLILEKKFEGFSFVNFKG